VRKWRSNRAHRSIRRQNPGVSNRDKIDRIIAQRPPGRPNQLRPDPGGLAHADRDDRSIALCVRRHG
jgi:hypothetical protein